VETPERFGRQDDGLIYQVCTEWPSSHAAEMGNPAIA
jgi:hypothetical protein